MRAVGGDRPPHRASPPTSPSPDPPTRRQSVSLYGTKRSVRRAWGHDGAPVVTGGPQAVPKAWRKRVRGRRYAGRAMVFRQITHDDLGCASYLIGDEDAGVAAVVDPKLGIDEYLALARYIG